jgi:hypothetical protein
MCYSSLSTCTQTTILKNPAAVVFCASDYVGAWGGIELLRQRGVAVDVVSGSVTDSRMGEDYIKSHFSVPAANARRDGAALFDLVIAKVTANGARVTV